MGEVIPGMRIGVETAVTRSLNTQDRDPRYPPGARPAAHRDPPGASAGPATGLPDREAAVSPCVLTTGA
jgi:hypothetical protein